jgi:hypothetical protein
MIVACPRGHESRATDYCDQCGAPIAAAPRAGTTQVLPALDEIDTSPAARREPCPACGAPRSGDDRYCEGCGFDFNGPPPAAGAWEAVVTADRDQFDRLAVAGISFPTDYAERKFVLAEGENRIGRSRGRPDEQAPEIDLAPAPVDPGVSRLHAMLERRSDGAIFLHDLGSTNGTMVNDDPVPIAPETALPLADGDRVRVGAWTTILVRKR